MNRRISSYMVLPVLLLEASSFSAFAMEKDATAVKQSVDFSQTEQIKDILAQKKQTLEELRREKEALEQEKTRRVGDNEQNPAIKLWLLQEIERKLRECDVTIEREGIELNLIEIALREVKALFNDSEDLKGKLAENENANMSLSDRLRELQERQIQRDTELQQLRSKSEQGSRIFEETLRDKSALESKFREERESRERAEAQLEGIAKQLRTELANLGKAGEDAQSRSVMMDGLFKQAKKEVEEALKAKAALEEELQMQRNAHLIQRAEAEKARSILEEQLQRESEMRKKIEEQLHHQLEEASKAEAEKVHLEDLLRTERHDRIGIEEVLKETGRQLKNPLKEQGLAQAVAERAHAREVLEDVIKDASETREREEKLKEKFAQLQGLYDAARTTAADELGARNLLNIHLQKAKEEALKKDQESQAAAQNLDRINHLLQVERDARLRAETAQRASEEVLQRERTAHEEVVRRHDEERAAHQHHREDHQRQQQANQRGRHGGHRHD